MTRISVIIPTRNRPGPLAACLRALQAGFPPDAETIVVSDGGHLDLSHVVAPFLLPLRLRLFHVPFGGPSAARNRGLQAALGEIALFTDDDCCPCPGWTALLASGVRLSPPVAAGGATFNGLSHNLYAETAQLVLLLLSRHDRALAGRERLLASNNLALPTAELRRLGGFNELYRTAEDRELCRRWAAAGFALCRVPNAVVHHHDNLTLPRFARKFFSYGRGAARFHRSGQPSAHSLRSSLAFHFRLPAMMLPEMRRRGLLPAASIAALLAVWEFANLLGYLAERWQPSIPPAETQ